MDIPMVKGIEMLGAEHRVGGQVKSREIPINVLVVHAAGVISHVMIAHGEEKGHRTRHVAIDTQTTEGCLPHRIKNFLHFITETANTEVAALSLLASSG